MVNTPPSWRRHGILCRLVILLDDLANQIKWSFVTDCAWDKELDPFEASEEELDSDNSNSNSF